MSLLLPPDISTLPLFCKGHKRIRRVTQTVFSWDSVLEFIVNLGFSLKKMGLDACSCGRPCVMSYIRFFCCWEDFWKDRTFSYLFELFVA